MGNAMSMPFQCLFAKSLAAFKPLKYYFLVTSTKVTADNCILSHLLLTYVRT